MQNRRIVLITGANRGLGLHLAKKLASNYDLILTSRKIEAANEAKQQIEHLTQHSKILTHQLDVSNLDSIKNLKNWLVKENIHLDVLVNNAGVGLESKGKEIIDINVQGVINVSEQLQPQLTDDGKILIVSSYLGTLSLQPKETKELLSHPKTKEEILKLGYDLVELHTKTGGFGNWANSQFNNQDGGFYYASKALATAYGRYVLSKLVKPNQSVYILHPGWIQTDMGGKEAPGTLDEGIVTSTYLIETLPFKRDEKYHGKYFNDKATVEDY